MSPIRCRVAACREELGDGQGWSFYLINDGATALDEAVLVQAGTEWGDRSVIERPGLRISGLAPGTPVRIWRDDGEFRAELRVQVRHTGREAVLSFEFPRLYRQQERLRPIPELGKDGWEVVAET